MISVSYYTDPACPWSWAGEPAVRKLMVQFGGSLRWTFVMGGFARDGQKPWAFRRERMIGRFGRATTKEVEAVCELPGPRAGADLYRLAEQGHLRPLWGMTGYLWELKPAAL